MQQERNFIEGRNRYHYDFSLLDEGYLQVDTEQDFSHYGNWVHFDKRIFIGFAEGDETITRFDNDAEMAEYIRDVYELKHVDLGIRGRSHAESRAREIGIFDLCA